MRSVAYLITAAIALPTVALAGVFDDTDDLQGKTIVYAGDIQQVSCPIGGKYDCLQWPRGFYKTTTGACFVTDEATCSFSCKALIATDSSRQVSVYIPQTIGASMKKGSFQSYKCPSPF